MNDDKIAHTFAKLMMEEKVNSALRFVSDFSKGGVLSLDITTKRSDGCEETHSVRDILHRKHPSGKPAQNNFLLYGPVDSIDLIIYDAVDGASIYMLQHQRTYVMQWPLLPDVCIHAMLTQGE